MTTNTTEAQLIGQYKGWSDEQIIDRVLAGEHSLYELLMRRYNQRIYSVVRAILRDDGEAEDVMQEAYVRAYHHLSRFERRSSFSTWLTRIAVHEAMARAARNKRFDPLGPDEDEYPNPTSDTPMNPEEVTANAETRALLERAILALPQNYRLVLVMRDIEELSTFETASVLEVTEDAVKVRLHRARALLRRELYQRVGATSASAFHFHASRCDAVAHNVLNLIGA